MKRWKQGFVQTHSMRTCYLRTGGDKPPLILLHGLMTSGACFYPLAKELEEHYDLIMPDARYHGESSAVEQGYSYATLALDLLSFIEALGLKQPIVLGHSMGGMTAALAAAQSPKAFKKLILVDPTFLSLKRQHEVYESDVFDQHRLALKCSEKELVTKALAKKSNRSLELLVTLAKARLQTSIHALEILKPPYPDYHKLISSLKIPGLLIIGGEKAVVCSLMAKELMKLNFRLQVQQIEEAGHGMVFDEPKRLRELMRSASFL